MTFRGPRNVPSGRSMSPLGTRRSTATEAKAAEKDNDFLSALVGILGAATLTLPSCGLRPTCPVPLEHSAVRWALCKMDTQSCRSEPIFTGQRFPAGNVAKPSRGHPSLPSGRHMLDGTVQGTVTDPMVTCPHKVGPSV